MEEINMNRAEFVGVLAEKTGTTKVKAEELLKGFLETVEVALVEEGDLSFVGFGKYEVKETKERQGHNPKTMEAITIPAKKVVKFKAGKTLAEAKNQ